MTRNSHKHTLLIAATLLIVTSGDAIADIAQHKSSKDWDLIGRLVLGSSNIVASAITSTNLSNRKVAAFGSSTCFALGAISLTIAERGDRALITGVSGTAAILAGIVGYASLMRGNDETQTEQTMVLETTSPTGVNGLYLRVNF